MGKKLHEKKTLSRIISIVLWCIAVVYLLAFIKIVVFKNGFTKEFRSLSFIPFQFIGDFFRTETSLDVFLKNNLGNIAIFIPMGILLPVLFKSIDFKKSVLICFITSLTIEVTQYIIGFGMTDIDDLMLNTLGATIGSLLYFRILEIIDKKMRFKLATLIFLFIFGIGGVITLWLYQPNILPTQNIIINQELLGDLDPDSFDVDVVCIGMKGNILNTSINSYNENEKINSNKDSQFIVDTNTQYFARTIGL